MSSWAIRRRWRREPNWRPPHPRPRSGWRRLSQLLRTVTPHAREMDDPPPVRAVEFDDDRVEVLFADPAPFPPTGWTSSNGGHSWLHRITSTEPAPSVRQLVTPALVTLGRRAGGGEVLLDIETAGSTSLVGARAACLGMARSIDPRTGDLPARRADGRLPDRPRRRRRRALRSDLDEHDDGPSGAGRPRDARTHRCDRRPVAARGTRRDRRRPGPPRPAGVHRRPRQPQRHRHRTRRRAGRAVPTTSGRSLGRRRWSPVDQRDDHDRRGRQRPVVGHHPHRPGAVTRSRRAGVGHVRPRRQRPDRSADRGRSRRRPPHRRRGRTTTTTSTTRRRAGVRRPDAGCPGPGDGRGHRRRRQGTLDGRPDRTAGPAAVSSPGTTQRRHRRHLARLVQPQDAAESGVVAALQARPRQ